MILYQPSNNEILATATRVQVRHPRYKSQIEKATIILANINANLDTDSDTWRVRSQSDCDRWHAVSSAGCSCDDYKFHAAKLQGAHYYCKHLHAYYAYRRLLTNALSRRQIGNIKFRNERLRAQKEPGGWLAETDRRGHGPRAVAYSGYHHFPRHLCNLRIDADDRMIPLDVADYLAVAEWLPRVPTFEQPQPLPRMEDYTREWSPEWSHGDFRHWLATGDVPGMRVNF